ncbi:hypothetical protein ACN42_g11440 [Penicillium freii]|uniref:Uncharacterized protein n=1 Tax=Penicillium freii TaxID=48697 RepID=A0A101M875_PENFR|nr:hypothetical protein ACN42_g11440 [Penicillium freii]
MHKTPIQERLFLQSVGFLTTKCSLNLSKSTLDNAFVKASAELSFESMIYHFVKRGRESKKKNESIGFQRTNRRQLVYIYEVRTRTHASNQEGLQQTHINERETWSKLIGHEVRPPTLPRGRRVSLQ